MTWKETIERRRHKEAVVMNPISVSMSPQHYVMALERGLRVLNTPERAAIVMRFLDPQPISGIAERLGMSWEGADRLIDRAVEKIMRVFVGSAHKY